MKIQISPLDQLYSQIIRTLAKGICQRCLRPTDFKRLQTAHFHGRANKKVRWDLDNSTGLCYGCHAYIDSHALEKADFFKKLLGDSKYEKLNQRANWPSKQKIDKKMIGIVLTNKLRELENDKVSGYDTIN